MPIFRQIIRAGASAACIIASPCLGQSQETSGSETRNFSIGDLEGGEIDADSLKIELNTPTTPAAAILGDDTLSLSSLRTSSDFFGQLLSGIGDDGTIQPGIAIGGGPYWWFGGEETLNQYRATPYPLLVLKRTQLGLATKSAPNDGDNDTLIGVSLSWQLLKNQDPRFFEAGEACLASALEPVVTIGVDTGLEAQARALAEFYDLHPEVNQDPEFFQAVLDADASGQLADEYELLFEKHLAEIQQEIAQGAFSASLAFDEDAYGKARDQCRKQYSEYLRERDSLAFTVATAFSSNEGRFDDFSEDKTSLWLSYKSGSKGLLGGLKIPVQAFAGYTFDEEVELENDIFERADRLTLGLGVSLENENESVDIQASYIRTDFKSALEPTGDYRLTASYSRRISDYLWLELKAGATKSDVLDDASFAGLNLKVDTAALLNN